MKENNELSPLPHAVNELGYKITAVEVEREGIYRSLKIYC